MAADNLSMDDDWERQAAAERSGTGVFTAAHRQAVSSALATASAAQRNQFPAA
jgi:hypothetical protein